MNMPNLVENNNYSFVGFHSPTSNTTYIPNQFFDVCLPNYSRGVSRLVGYMLRKTLGWCDKNGKPQESIIPISYDTIIKEANISRRALKTVIQDAVKGNFVRFVRIPKPKRPGKNYVTGLLEIKWDEASQYTSSPDEFKGFFAGEGNRTYIPNEYFDVTLKQEPLRVSKVVGTIIRQSIGFVNKYGHRKREIQMSVSEISYFSNLCRGKVDRALKEAIAGSYITLLEKGNIDLSNSSNSTKAVYCIKWCGSNGSNNIDAKRYTKKSEDRCKKVYERTTISVQKGIREEENIGAKKCTEDWQKGEREKGKKAHDLIKEIKPLNKTFKQQQVVDVKKSIKILTDFGFSLDVASSITRNNFSDTFLDIVNNQINWLPLRNPSKNKFGLLRKAIEENWSKPIKNDLTDVNKNGFIFVQYFYAGYASNPGTPITEPTSLEIEIASNFCLKLLDLCPDLSKVSTWGYDFGSYTKSKLNENKNLFMNFGTAIRSFGETFYISFKNKIINTTNSLGMINRESHEKEFYQHWLDYLLLKEETFKTSREEDYLKFITYRNDQRELLTNSPFTLSTTLLEDYDATDARLLDFHTYFSNDVLSFWEWDSQVNERSLK